MKSKKLTKANLYQDITKQGFILPKSSSTICNLAYLLRVRNGTEYCPLKEEVNGVFCSNPPKKLLLLVYVQEELEKNGDMRTLSFDEKHLPDVDWCLKALSSLDPLHQIFEPDYMPPFNHRGRRGIRYSPTAEDLLFIDEEKLGDTGNRNPSNQPVQDPASQYPSSHKEESKTSDFRKQFNQQAKNDKSFFNKAFKGQHESSQSQDRQSDELEDIKSKNFSKDLIENKQIGPLVQMLKTLDNKGLLEECMQHYIEIQTSYDNVIYEKQQSKTSSEIMKIQPLCKDRKKGYYFTQQKNYKRKDIQCHFKQKQNQFTQIQSPTSKLVYDDENSNLKCLSYQYKKLQQPKDFESHQTSASSDVKNQMHQMPAQIQKKVKNFKTSEQTDVQKEEQLNTQDQLMTEENEVLQFKEDRVNPIDGQEENQASDKDSTPQAVFII